MTRPDEVGFFSGFQDVDEGSDEVYFPFNHFGLSNCFHSSVEVDTWLDARIRREVLTRKYRYRNTVSE